MAVFEVIVRSSSLCIWYVWEWIDDIADFDVLLLNRYGNKISSTNIDTEWAIYTSDLHKMSYAATTTYRTNLFLDQYKDPYSCDFNSSETLYSNSFTAYRHKVKSLFT